MTATNQIRPFFGEVSTPSIRSFTENLVVPRNKDFVFSKLNALTDLPLLFEIGKSLGNLVPKDVHAICVLATSGIPLGIIAGLSQRKSIYFFHRMGLERNGPPIFIMPEPPPGISMSIVDSHVRSGFTSSACFLELTGAYRVYVEGICAALFFEENLKHSVGTNYRFLSRYSDTLEYISGKIHEHKQDTESRLQDQASIFWSFPPGSEFSENEFVAKYKLEKISKLSFQKVSEPLFKLLSRKTRELIKKNIVNSDIGVWDFFQDSGFVEEVCREAGQQISIQNYDHIIGILPLGLSFSLALAYYNQDFVGQISCWLGEFGLLPDITDWRGKKILLVSLRSQYGTYIADVSIELAKRGGAAAAVLVAIPDPKLGSFVNRLRQSSLVTLKNDGVELFSLS